jgi:phage terminase large subunit-like protein
LVPYLPLDTQAAQRAVAAYNRLRLPDVPGNPTLGEAGGEWFRDVVRAVFGSWDPAARLRYIQEVFVLVGKKNSKTTNAAALGLVWLLLNERPNAAGAVLAPTQDISEVAYSQAEGMVFLDAGLRNKRIRTQNHLRKLTNTRTGATLEIFTFDPAIVTGQKFAFWLLDEIHVLSRMSKAASALGQLRGGMISIPEAVGVIITTQSDTPPSGIFKTELNKARGIRDGDNTVTRMLPVLYEFPDDIARDPVKWRDVRNWPMVVPNNGLSITVDRLAAEFATAEQSGPEEIIRWASQHLNIEIGVGLKTDHWPGARNWQKNADASLSLDGLIARSDLITIGVDGGGLDDMLGLAVLGRERDTGRWLHWGHAWLHVDVLELRKSEAPKFMELRQVGDLTIVERMSDAFAEVADIIEQVHETGLLEKTGFDPFGVKLILDELARRGITQEAGQVEGVSQGYKLQGTIKSVEDKLCDGDLVHGDQPLMNWCVGNCLVKVTGNSIMVTKQASGTGKIDPVMALFDAAFLMLKCWEPTASVYETRGLVVLG